MPLMGLCRARSSHHSQRHSASSGVWSQRSFGGKLGQDKRNPPNRQQRQEYNSHVHSCILSSYHSLCRSMQIVARSRGAFTDLIFRLYDQVRQNKRAWAKNMETCTESPLSFGCSIPSHSWTEPSGGCLGICPCYSQCV